MLLSRLLIDGKAATRPGFPIALKWDKAQDEIVAVATGTPLNGVAFQVKLDFFLCDDWEEYTDPGGAAVPLISDAPRRGFQWL